MAMCSRDKTPSKFTLKNLSFASAIGALAGSPWLFQASYSRGYDYFLWLYNSHILLENLLNWNWPNWTSISAAGHPLFKMGGLTDALVFSFFIGSLGFDLGPRIYVFLIYCLSAIGIYMMVRQWDISHYSALITVAAYVFSWFLTYTVDYTTYLSNFLLYALMPWGALCFIIALRKRSIEFLFLSSFLLFFAIAANAQVSIRVAFFVVAVGLIDKSERDIQWTSFFSYVASYVLIAGSLAAFIIVSAIDLKFEVVQLASYRTNALVPPWDMLLGLPILGIYLVGQRLGYEIDVEPKFLASVIHSDYVGFSVLSLALFGLWCWRRDVTVRRIVYCLSVSLIVYWLIVPFLPNAAWIGSTHNWAVLHTFWLSLLAGFGFERLKRLKSICYKSTTFFVLAVCFILLELGGARILLGNLALKHESPYNLPEVKVWQKLVDEIGPHERWFTFDLDHTHYLYPIMTSNKAISNIIELRSRKTAYDSFLNHQKKSMRRLDPTYNPSESLALLNARFIDLPIKTFAYRNDISNYVEGVNLLLQDTGFDLVLKRPWHPLDGVYDASEVKHGIEGLFRNEKPNDFSQVVFRNQKSLWGFVANYTIAIIGDRLECEKLFERITHLNHFKAEKILYLLITKDEFKSLEKEIVNSIDAFVPIDKELNMTSHPTVTVEDISVTYERYNRELITSIPLERVFSEDEAMGIRIGKRENDRFLFLSQQHFSHWFAFTEKERRSLPVFTSGGGLTAIWVPERVNRIEYRYIVPFIEQFARIWSILTIVFCFGCIAVARFRLYEDRSLKKFEKS